MRFDEFRLGQTLSAGPRHVSAQDLAEYTRLSGDDHPIHTDPTHPATARFGAPILQGSFGSAVAAGLWRELGVVDDTVVAALGDSWDYHRPILVGDALTLTTTVIRLERSAKGSTGVLTRYCELRDADGRLVQSGTSRVLLQAEPVAADDPVPPAVGTLAWGRALAESLGADPAFASATDSWDGTIGLRGGDAEVHLRIYRGRVIDVARRTPHGPTFTFGATDRTWADVLAADTPDFGRRLMTGQFQAGGDPYEYLRLTKVVEQVVDHAHALANRQPVTTPAPEGVPA
jgi:acyl dehydratase